MATKAWRQIRRKLSDKQEAENKDWIERELLQMSLREMREMVGKNQVELAAEIETTQGELSRLERRNDFFLSTLKKYVEALGGEVQVIAKFGDKTVRLRGV